jgi:hypothetical protein
MADLEKPAEGHMIKAGPIFFLIEPSPPGVSNTHYSTSESSKFYTWRFTTYPHIFQKPSPFTITNILYTKSKNIILTDTSQTYL